MKILWERLTLIRFASDEDDGRIQKWEAALFIAILVAFFWIVVELGGLFY